MPKKVTVRNLKEELLWPKSPNHNQILTCKLIPMIHLYFKLEVEYVQQLGADNAHKQKFPILFKIQEG
jgi:hypothetical protein